VRYARTNVGITFTRIVSIKPGYYISVSMPFFAHSIHQPSGILRTAP
jgi:hypothetical protein